MTKTGGSTVDLTWSRAVEQFTASPAAGLTITGNSVSTGSTGGPVVTSMALSAGSVDSGDPWVLTAGSHAWLGEETAAGSGVVL